MKLTDIQTNIAQEFHSELFVLKHRLEMTNLERREYCLGGIN